MKRWQTLLLLLIVAFLPYSVALFTGQQLGPTEHIQTMVTPDAPKPSYGWDVLQADGVLQFLPWRDLVFDAWRKGEAPMMNPYQLAGQPLTANSQSGGFYPLHMLFAFVPGSTGFKIILLGILHLFIAGTGLYYLLRNLKVSETGSLLGATVFVLSQFMVAWAPLASVPSTVAWIPWVLAGITCSNRKVGFFQVSLATAMMLYAGHLQFAFYGMFAAFVVWAWNMAYERKAAALIPLVALFVGVVVAMPQVGIVLKNSRTSHRQNVPTATGYDDYTKGSLAVYEALGFISPDLLGNPLKVPQLPTDEARTATPVMPAFGYWSMLAKRGANPAECALWISPIALTLAFVGLAIRRPKEGESSSVLPAVLVLVLGFLLTFGSPLNQLLFFNFPGWSATGSPGRAHVLIVLALCILAAIGYDRLEVKSDGSKKWYALALVPFVLLGLGFNVLNMLGGMLAEGMESPTAKDMLSNVIAVTTKPLLPGIALMAVISAAVLALFSSKKLPKLAYLPAGIIALTLIGQHPLSGKPLEVPTEAPTQERHVFASRGWGMTTTPKATMPPNIASLARVHDLFGYDSMLDKGFVEKLKTALGGAEPAVPENGNLMLARLKNGENYAPEVTAALSKLGADQIDRKNPDSILKNSRIIAVNNSGNQDGEAHIDYDGYDHQIISIQPGTSRILIKDRYFQGMTTPTTGAKLSEEDGWRLIETDGTVTSVRIDYPGRMNFIGVIIGIAFLLIGYVLVSRKHESNPTEA